MRLKTRMTRIYALLCIMAACSIAAVYYHYNKRTYLDREWQLLQTYTEQLCGEFDILSEDMNFAVTYVLGEVEVLDGLKQLIRSRENPDYPEAFKQEALFNIRNVLMNNFLNKNFYRVRIINEKGIVLTKNSVSDETMDFSKYIGDIDWLDDVRGRKGASVLIGSRMDDMEPGQEIPIISMAKEILGYDGSYIEVQYKVSELEKKLSVREDIKGIIIARKDGEIIYASCGLPKRWDTDLPVLSQTGSGSEGSGPENSGSMAASYTSGRNDFKITAIGDGQKVKDQLVPLKETTVLVALSVFGILMVYVYLSVGIIVRPVKKLQSIMEITELENMDKEIKLDSRISEFDALAQSYEKLLRRLQKSINRNKKMEQLHLQAQFDSLQAKISPHFMANVLNVINSRGLELGDTKISRICASMAALLRYASDTKKKEAAVEEEE